MRVANYNGKASIAKSLVLLVNSYIKIQLSFS